MKNLFNVIVHRTTQKIESEYKHWIIRQVTKKQEEKLQSLGQTYSTAQRKNNIPKWLYLWLRLSSTLVFTSFVFFLAMLFMSLSKGLDHFLIKYLWLEILFGLGIVSLVLAILVRVKLNSKRKPEQNAADQIFNTILDTSKQFLKIPHHAFGLEVLSLQLISRNDKIQMPKHKIYNNIVLSVFIEEDKLCFADLYDVIGIPLAYLTSINQMEEPYHFKFWHKKESFTAFQGISLIKRPTLCYEGTVQYQLKFKKENEEYEIRIPSYEIAELENLLKGRISYASTTSEF